MQAGVDVGGTVKYYYTRRTEERKNGQDGSQRLVGRDSRMSTDRRCRVSGGESMSAVGAGVE